MRTAFPYEQPRLKADRRIDVVDAETVFLTVEGRHHIVSGAAAVAVLPLLDGTRTLAELADALSEQFPLGEVLATVHKLGAFGHLVDGPLGGLPPEAAWWDHLDVGAAAAASRLAAGRVVLAATGQQADAAAGAVAALLPGAAAVPFDSLAGAGPPDDARPADPVGAGHSADDLAVVLVDDYLNPALEGANQARLRGGSPWLLARVTGFELWLGPLFRPGETGCWACLAQRLRANRQVERFVQTATGGGWSDPGVAVMLPATLQSAAGLVAAEAQRIVVTGTSPTLDGTLVTVDLMTLASERHTLVRQPQCPACGDPGRYQKPVPVVLVPSPAVDADDGGHRIQDPVVTVERLEPHVSRLIGAITGVHRLTRPGDEVLHAYVSGHNFAMLSMSTYLLRRNVRGLSGGKGRTDVQARASAMCEAIERYTGVWRGDEPTVRASMEELGPEAVDPESLLGFSDGQYEGRLEWNRRQRSGLHIVPHRFDRTRPVDWTQVWSLTADRPRFVPTAYCYFGHPDLDEQAFCHCDANGNAAGNTVEEAVLQGLLELVERDAVAIWWYNRSRVPAVDLASIDDPYVEVLQRYYAEMGRSLWVLDITTDLGIPAFVAVSHRLDAPVEDILLGFGAHVDPRVGVMRALTECNQFLPAVVERDEHGVTRYDFDDEEACDWWRHATLESEPYVVPSPGAPQTDLSTSAPPAGRDIAEEIRSCVERLRSVDIEVMVLDQTRPDLDLHVAKVMAPGLRHFWRRLGPGRLYDVAVGLGRAAVPTAEAELNPKSVFF